MNNSLKIFGFLIFSVFTWIQIHAGVLHAQGLDNSDAQPFSNQSSANSNDVDEDEEYVYVAEHDEPIQVGLLAGTSLWATEPSTEMDPGFSGQLRFAYEVFAGFSIETYFSALYNNIKDLDKTFLWNYGFSGGFRYSFINPSPIVPYISAHAQVSLWTGDGCSTNDGGITTCGTQFSNEASFVTGGLVGIIFELNTMFGLEVGSRLDVSFPGSVFPEVQFYASPYAGMMFYF